MIRRVAFGVAAVAALVACPPAGADPIEACDSATRPRLRNGWTFLPAPAFASGERAVSAFAARHESPGDLVATNGRGLAWTATGGCRWGMADLPDADREASFVSVTASPTQGTADVVFATFATTDDRGFQRPGVLRSVDGGRTWQDSSEGLADAVGPPVALTVSPADADFLYLLVAESRVGAPVAVETDPTLWRSTDGGESWTQANLAQPVRSVHTPVATVIAPIVDRPLAGAVGITASVTERGTIWVYGRSPLVVSRDGGLRYQQAWVGSHTGVSLPAIAGVVAADGFAMSLDARVARVLRTTDGASFLPQTAPPSKRVRAQARGRGLAIALTGSGSDHVVSTEKGVFAAFGSTPYERVAGPGDLVHGLVADPRGTGALLTGRAHGGIVQRLVEPPATARPPGERRDDPVRRRPLRPVLGAAAPGAPRLSPRSMSVSLAEGAVAERHYELSLPGRRAVDVVFLVDVSDSMSEEIDGLRAGMRDIAAALSDDRIDARFAVAQYRDYQSGPAYELIRDLGPADASLDAALGLLKAQGGGDETALAALAQVATGAGQDDQYYSGVLARPTRAYIAPDQAATFRPDALRVVVHATDEAMNETPVSPSFTDAARALGGKNVRHVGVAFELVEPPVENASFDAGAYTGLTRMSRLTSGFAPDGGVDCDGDGTTTGSADVAGGAPLVCRLPADAPNLGALMSGAISRSVAALHDFASVGLEVAGGDERSVTFVPAAVPAVDLKSSSAVHFDALVTCVGRTRERLRVVAVVRDVAVAEAWIDVRCAAAAAPSATTRRGPPGVGAAGPPLAPPAPISNAQPQPNAQTNTQPQAQSQAQAEPGLNGGVAAAHQERVRLAYAGAEERGDEVLAMSRHDDAAAGVLAAGMVLAGAAACAWRTGAAHRPACARVPRQRGP